MARKNRNLISTPSFKDHAKPSIDSPPLRDERGRLLPGQTANKSGVSKHSAEFKAMCEHVLMNNGWDVWNTTLMDPKTPAIVRHAMVEWLHAVVHGKPGVRKEEAGGPSVEDLKKMLPPIIINNGDRLRAEGYELPKNSEDEPK